MSDEKVRAFIAIAPDAILRQACTDVAAAARGLPMRWVRPESVHLTLKFLGDVPVDAMPTIHQTLQQAAQGSVAFRVAVRGLGCFPNAIRPRVLWMGLDDPRRELLQLQRNIESTLTGLEMSADKRLFRPHLTLARTRGTPVGEELNALLNEYKNHLFGHLVVSRIHLMRSDLHEKGAVHTRLYSVALEPAPTALSRRAIGKER